MRAMRWLPRAACGAVDGKSRSGLRLKRAIAANSCEKSWMLCELQLPECRIGQTKWTATPASPSSSYLPIWLIPSPLSRMRSPRKHTWAALPPSSFSMVYLGWGQNRRCATPCVQLVVGSTSCAGKEMRMFSLSIFRPVSMAIQEKRIAIVSSRILPSRLDSQSQDWWRMTS